MTNGGAGASAVKPDGPFLIGLTGPIGCGKSTVAQMLADVGGTVIDADVLARQVTEPGTPALARIRERFGEAVIKADGTLDRSALGAIVFSDPVELAALERIVHPPVRSLVDAELARAATERVPFVVVEAIKLVEGGLADRCDEVWLVECSAAAQRRRLRHRGLADEDIEQRLAAQGVGLADRLAAEVGERVVVRRVSTEADLNATRQAVEEALAEALEPLVSG